MKIDIQKRRELIFNKLKEAILNQESLNLALDSLADIFLSQIEINIVKK